MYISPLAGVPAYAISRLQSALNAAARLVFSLQKYDSVTLLLQELHWLKVEQRIEYKLAVLVYRCLHGLASPYLANDFRRVADLGTRRRLRSASTPALVVPPSRLSTVGDRAFPVAAARVWNSLPDILTASTSLPMFKRHLKTVLFACIWPSGCHCHLMSLNCFSKIQIGFTFLAQAHPGKWQVYSSLQGCHTATGTHMPYGITQCYLPPVRGDISALTPVR